MINIRAQEDKRTFEMRAEVITLRHMKKMDMRRRLEARVYGQVQGVFFRHFTRLKAQELGITGSVTNEPNGTVFVIAEGLQEDVINLLEWLKHGPDLARVDRVDAQWSQPSGEFGFTILR